MRWHIKTHETTPHHHTDTSHSHFQHLLADLHLFIYSRVFEELHTEIALPQGRVTLHAVTWAAYKQHLHAVLTSGSEQRVQRVPFRWMRCHLREPWQAGLGLFWKCVGAQYVLGMRELFSLEKSKAVIFISCLCKSSSGPAVDNYGYEKIL